jgi:hypothetical protein
VKKNTAFPSLGDDVSIVFLDHCQDGECTIVCTARGIICKVNDTEVGIESWTTHCDNAPHNRTRFHIVRSTIIKIITKKEVSQYEPPRQTANRKK